MWLFLSGGHTKFFRHHGATYTCVLFSYVAQLGFVLDDKNADVLGNVNLACACTGLQFCRKAAPLACLSA